MKSFFIQTLGCKVNQYESQAMREALLGAGYVEADSKKNADIYLLNTCTVTERADKESRYLAGSFSRSSPGAKVVVTGCYVEKDAGEIASIPGVTHIVRNGDKDRIAELVSEPFSPRAASVRHEQRSALDHRPSVKITGFKGHTKAFVKIQDGCENACAYCKVPLVRGALRSRPLGDILDEAAALAGNGYKELVLTGICLGAWGKDLCCEETASAFGLGTASLIDVLKALLSIRGSFRIRISSIEPKYVTDELIELMAGEERICRHLHMPLQSGDDKVLRMMKRPYTTAGYARLVERARGRINDLAITTDVMVGFPGETAELFKNSLDFVRCIAPARTHIFTFSRRQGTAAYSMPGCADAVTAKARHGEMEGVGLNASYLFRRGFVGKSLNVLVESKRDKDSGLLTGYSDNYIDVLFSGPDTIMNSIAPVSITGADPANTIGVYE